ncbi:MAG TPA: zinc ribbon domain-containing protein [Fimbriimonadaceae bacterium]|nr:zinc ribbon domain-containing protein [Fimbriimonadaceae bacterium]
MDSLHDVALNHPQFFLIAAVTWMALAVWIVSLIGWMVMGEIEGLFGTIGIGVALALGYFAIRPPTLQLQPFAAVATILTIVTYPILRKAVNDRELLLIDVEAMEDAYESLALKPENHAVRFKLAKLLYERGHVEPGMAVAAAVMRDMPEKLYPEENRIFSRWKRQQPGIDAAKPIPCFDCGHHNPGSAIFCERCGRPYLLDRVRGVVLGGQFGKKLMAGWIAGILALIGIPMASTLPPVPAIVVMVAIMACAGLVIGLALRPAKRVTLQ